MINPHVLKARLKTLDTSSEKHRARIALWLEITFKQLGLT